MALFESYERRIAQINKFLNDNGFDVKGPNSNIEDDAIAFLMKGFSKKQVTAEKTEKEEKAKK